MKKLFPRLALLALSCGAALAQQTAPTRLPEVSATDTATAVSGLREEAPADATGRPEWTSARRFSTTRVYIQQAPWEVGFEQWVRFRKFRDGTSQFRFQEEIEIGLPYRMQLDIYENWVVDEHRRADQDEFSVELRWAFADWGKIPLNPTLYAEYAFVNKDSNVVELKLLLGEQLAPRVHWGVNLVYEQQVSGSKATAFQATQGLSYSVLDEKLGVGVEMKYQHETAEGSRGNPEHQFLIGPSLQWRPSPRTHLDLVALFGTTNESPRTESYLIFGIEFGKISGKSEPHGYTPVSGFGN